MDAFAITDAEFGITFSSPQRATDGWLEQFLVILHQPGLEAQAWVENSRYVEGPEVFFAALAEEWRGWQGEKVWRALGGELQLVAASDSRGHVTLQVQLQPSIGAEGWRAVVHAYLEAGQLDRLSTRAAQFFGREP